MKWSDLTLSERKKLYDSVKSEDPNITYLELKQQFDSIPEYEDGGKKLNKQDLPLEYQIGTPEYFARQQSISGRAESVQPEAYVTPAGYVKDAMNFIENLADKDYRGAAIDAALNIIPWGVGKTIKQIKSKVGRAIEGSSSENYRVSTTVKDPANPPVEIENSVRGLDKRASDIRKKYNKEIYNTLLDAAVPDKETNKLIKEVDSKYGTDYGNAFRAIAVKSLPNSNKLVSFGPLGESPDFRDVYGEITRHNTVSNIPSRKIEDHNIVLNDNIYSPGTANHELGHLADDVAGSRMYYNENGNIYTVNPYTAYLADSGNAYTYGELRRMGLNSTAANRDYLLNPTEAKSHMLTLKRGLSENGTIQNWSDPVTLDMVQNYVNTPGIISTLKDQLLLYKDPTRYIERINYLTPMQMIPPVLVPFAGYEYNKENNR